MGEGCRIPGSTKHQETIGNTTVDICVYSKQGKGQGIVFLNVHDSEKIAVDAAQRVVDASGGTIVELSHQGTREVTFKLGETEWKFDPNRIFTPQGREKTLKLWNNARYAQDAADAVEKFAGKLLQKYLPKGNMVIALHNNTDGKYSVDSYRQGGKKEDVECAKSVSAPTGKDPDDFFFVTREKDYDAFAAGGFNVVLQNNGGCADDGSLSIFSGQNGNSPWYINVEAEYAPAQQNVPSSGHVEEQVKMLQAAADYVREQRCDHLCWAKSFAPVFLTEGKRYNIPLRVDFDGNWNAADNESHYDSFLAGKREYIQDPYKSSGSPLSPSIYYETIVTSTHVYLTYYLFFPHDADNFHTFEPGDPRGGHNNDATSLMVVVRKDDRSWQLYTQDHGKVSVSDQKQMRLYQGRPVVEITSGNHTLKAFHKGEALQEENKEERRNIFYYRHGEEGSSYDLVHIFDSLWPQRENESLFDVKAFGIGAQFLGRNGPWAPWSRPFSPKPSIANLATYAIMAVRGKVKSFSDPASVFCKDQAEKDCSRNYTYNPY